VYQGSYGHWTCTSTCASRFECPQEGPATLYCNGTNGNAGCECCPEAQVVREATCTTPGVTCVYFETSYRCREDGTYECIGRDELCGRVGLDAGARD
jgi:hypothetical protein